MSADSSTIASPAAGQHQEVKVEEFLEAVRDVLDTGSGFVPLIGAGLSAPSGVPIIREVHVYLRRCVARALGLDHPDVWSPTNPYGTLDYHRFRRWTPDTDRWPVLGDLQQEHRDTERWDDRLRRVLERFTAHEDHTGDRHPELSVFQEAYGAMADWRSALLFLSRLHTRSDTRQETAQNGNSAKSDVSNDFQQIGWLEGPLWYLGEQRADVIDTFFLSVILGKEPTLGHRMFARLSDALRVDTLLTTNFDDLMERAFAEIGRPVTVFDVHKEAGLPPYEDVRAGNALVKLHGGRYGLRADYSLDALPDDEDRRRFVSYLARRSIMREEWDKFRTSRTREPLKTRRHLFVVGISGKDQRIAALITSAAQVLEGLEIFWLCFTRNDEEDANALKARLLKIAVSGVAKGASLKFHILRHQFVGLFLLQLLQHRTKALPATGAIFPSGPRLPVPPQPFNASDETIEQRAARHGNVAKLYQRAAELDLDAVPMQVDAAEKLLGQTEARKKYVERLREAIDRVFKPGSHRPRLLLATSGKDVKGVVSCAAEAFEGELNDGRQCVWLDLDEITSADDLFEQLLHAIARKAGIADWMPVIVEQPLLESADIGAGDDYPMNARIREIRRLTNHPHREWVVFLNARDGAGTNALGFQFADAQKKWGVDMPNGWLDYNGSEKVSGSGEVKIPLDADANGPIVVNLLQSICGWQHEDGAGSVRTGCPNVSIVVLCHEPHDVKEFKAFVDFVIDPPSEIDGSPEVPFQFTKPDPPIRLTESCTPYNAQRAIDEAVAWATADDPNDAHEQTKFARVRFLYALCLTNRTRYPALLWSWAFHGRNPMDMDNVIETQTRQDNTRKWLTQLASLHAIRWKAGGFVWMHCEIRNGIRDKLGTQGLRELGDDTLPEEAGDLAPTVAEWMETLIHHALAEWWGKLFLASGDSSAAFEAIYHRCCRVERLFRNPDERNMRVWSRERSSRQMFSLSEGHNDLAAIHRLLSQAKRTLLVSGFSKGSCRRLDAIRRFLGQRIEPHLHRLADCLTAEQRKLLSSHAVVFPTPALPPLKLPLAKYEAIIRVLDRIYYTSIRLNRAIAREVAENQTAFKRQWELLWWVSNEEGESRFRRNQFDTVHRALSDGIVGERQRRLRLLLSLKKQKLAVVLEACIELGTLGIGIRSYKMSRTYLKLARIECGLKDSILESTDSTGDDYRFRIACWAEEITKQLGTPQARMLFYRILKVLQREQQLFLIEGRTKHLAARHHDAETSKSLRTEATNDFKRAEWWYRSAVEVQRFLARNEQLEESDPKLSGLDESSLRDGFDDRQRLLTQCAVACSFRNHDFDKAHRRLAEAEANLSHSGHGPTSMEMAIIELHRAEVLTHQIVLQERKERSAPESLTDFGQMRRQLLGLAESTGAQLRISILVEEFKNDLENRETGRKFPNRESFLQPRAFVADASQSLIRAESRLKYSRKNVWWSTWYFELQIKLIELRLFMSLGSDEIEFPLPFLGPQGAAIGTPALPDRLIDNAVRMIRFDVFRLSRIVESYGNCLLVLRIWRHRCFAQDGAALPQVIQGDASLRNDAFRNARAMFARQQDMERTLSKCRQELNTRLEIRQSLRTKLDENVNEYVTRVLKYTDFVLNVPHDQWEK